MIKISKQSNKVRFSREAWAYIGAKQGWMPTILSSIRKKQDSFKRFAQSESMNEPDEAFIEQAIKDSVGINYGSSFIFRDNDAILDEGQALIAIQNAFIALAKRENSFMDKIKTYLRANRPFSLGVYMSSEGNKRSLVPTFNGVGISEYRFPLTAAIPHEIALPPKTKTYDLGETDIRGVNSIIEMVEMISAAGYVSENAVVEIGSIGSRSTNWDTSYNLHIAGLNGEMLQKVLTWFTNIENKDLRNLMKTQISESFDLTMFNEVNNLMSRLGLGEDFIAKVKAVKEFEEDKGLKRKYRRNRRIEDYKNKTMKEEIRLSDHVEKIFTELLSKITKYPLYVQMLQESNIGDPQDFLSFAFTMGQQGNILTGTKAKEVVDMAAAA
jgi:hypothetical protein